MQTITIPGDPRDVTFDPTKSALIVTDLQGAFLEMDQEKATFAMNGLGIDPSKGGVKHVLPIIPRIQQLVDAYRQLSLPIVHLLEQYDSFHDVPWRWQQGAIGDPATQSLTYLQSGEAETSLRVIPPKAGETVFAKNGKNAFRRLHIVNGRPEPVLTTILREQLHVRHLIFTGVATSVCVGATAMSATEEGFDSILIEDACGDFFPERHTTIMKMFGLGREQKADLYGQVIYSYKDLLNALQKGVPIRAGLPHNLC